jgi:hypothetical protein
VTDQNDPAPAAPPPPATPLPQASGQTIEVRTPAVRRLRVYGFDPSLSTRLETVRLNETTVQIPWEDLQPGPVGEYIEVVDQDPATGCFYAPVDLNNWRLLAADGLAPSEGNPQFHQQMVYAVAMLTIQNFESALGRKAFWASKNADEADFVQRLRIYPHALRAQNAYYHPGKKALLFGYFPAESGDPKNILPGGVVFSCLSHDVVAHETTHALIDGMHRHFNYPTNPDLLAFHEAFADIVAVFQHFSLPGVLEARIAAVGGSLRTDRLMGDLAQEFGRGAGLQASLRTALTVEEPEENRAFTGVLKGQRVADDGDTQATPFSGNWADDLTQGVSLQGTLRSNPAPKKDQDRRIYEVWEPHDRGAILLGAVFDAFIRIYESRSKDLIRIATGGRDKLPPGPVNQDLAARLAREAAKSAQHVLNMCIRALDYCPVVDLNFGDFLRAIITADAAMVPTDEKDYRIAFIEAFRARGIYPQGVRSMSVDSLLWRSPEDKHFLQDIPKIARAFSDQFRHFYTRSHMHDYVRSKCGEFAQQIRATAPERLRMLGVDPALPFHVSSLRLSEKEGPYGRVVPQLILSVTQEKQVPLNEDESGPNISFPGGAAIIIDPQHLTVNYVIKKDIESTRRLKLQRDYLNNPHRSLRDLYFGDDPDQRFAMLHKVEV